MEIYPLKYFVAVAETENLTRAAEILNISPSSLSVAIRTLESDVGIQLFNRIGRNISLNKYGKTYLSYAKQILSLNEQSNNYIRRVQNNHDMQVYIADHTNVFASYIISAFLSTYPDVSVTRSYVSSDQCDYIRMPDNYDFLIGSTNSIRRPDLATQTIRCGKTINVVVNRRNSLASRTSLTIEDLRKLPIITFAPGYSGRKMIDEIFDLMGEAPNIVFEGNSPLTMSAALSENIGVFIQSKIASDFCMKVENLFRDCVAIQIENFFYQANTSLFWNPVHALSKSAQLFRHFCAEYSKNHNLIDDQ